MIGINTTFGTHYTTRDIIERRVNATPYPREAGLVGCVAIGGPLQGNIHAGSFLKKQKSAVGRNMKFTHSARKILITGEQGKCFGSSSRIRGVPRYIAGKRRRHERFSLMRHPVFGQYPAGAGIIGSRIGDRTETLPGV